jgi:hypothetical protein
MADEGLVSALRRPYIPVIIKDSAKPVMSSTATRIPLLALAATAGSIAAVSVTLSRPEALIDLSLHSALSRVVPVGEARTASGGQSAEVELLRPSSTGGTADDVSGFARSLAVGDRITITGKGGERRTLEVADVRPLVEPNRPASAPGPNLLLVTCAVLGGEPGAIVRFVIEDSGAVPANLPVTLHRAL